MYELNDVETLIIYTDASVSSGGDGGIGVRIISINENGDEIIDNFQSGGYRNVNSGQIEITACVYALEEVTRRQLAYKKRQVTIYTDSKYVAENYKNAMFHWVGNRWFQKDGRPVLDAKEWNQLVKQIQNHKKLGIFVDIKWVKGHDKNQHNNAVHKMAKDVLRLPVGAYSKNSVLSVFRPRQTITPKKMELGSVKVDGQKLSIKILSCEYLQRQKLWSYKYTVVSKKSRYRGSVDKIFSTISLDVGRSYYVKFNNDKRNPRLEKMYREGRQS